MRYNRFASFLAFVLVGSIAFAPISRAQTGDAQALLNQITQLLAQIDQLKAQIAALEVQKSAVSQQAAQSAVAYLRLMKQGDEGDGVTVLQALLAADPDIYPEALITGYYGSLTTNAIRRFQKKHGLEQVGFVGPRTLERLNDLFNQYPLMFASDDDNDDDDDRRNDDKEEKKAAKDIQKFDKNFGKAVKSVARLCAHVPPGHLIAKGWQKKNEIPIVPICQSLPPGIINKLPPSSTSTPDVTSPLISGIVAAPSTSTAVISWATNEPAHSHVAYGTSSAYGLDATNAALTATHALTLTGLSPNATYHYQVRSRDAAGNLATSSDRIFVTGSAAVPDTTAPVISGIGIVLASPNATVLWTTNESSTSKVYYATSTPVNAASTSTPFVSSSALITSHSIILGGLQASTTYYAVIESQDATGNKATSSEQMFVMP